MQLRNNSQQQSFSTDPRVRIIQREHDPLANLKGHDYIKARGLNKPVQRVQTSAHATSPAGEK